MTGTRTAEKIKLAAGICLYEFSLSSVKRCIESIKNHIDIIIVIDGRFDQFPATSLLSSREVREYLSSVENIILVDLPGSEVVKRQKYCDLCKQLGADYLLIIDSDEYIIDGGDWEEFRRNLSICDESRSVYGVRFAYAHPIHMDKTPYPRLWYRPYEIEYIHHNLWKNKSNGGEIKSTSEVPCIEGIIMAGNDNLHTPEYIDQGRIYQTFLIKQENPVEKTMADYFNEADLQGKCEIFLKLGGSGHSVTNDLICQIVDTIAKQKP